MCNHHNYCNERLINNIISKLGRLSESRNVTKYPVNKYRKKLHNIKAVVCLRSIHLSQVSLDTNIKLLVLFVGV